jgi:IS4 transposase
MKSIQNNSKQLFFFGVQYLIDNVKLLHEKLIKLFNYQTVNKPGSTEM